MNPTKLSSSIVQKLKKEDISPTPKWQFLLHSVLIAIAILIFLVIGVLAAAVVYIFITELHLLQIFDVRLDHGIKALLLGFPLFWFLTLIGFSLLVSFFAKKTETGYRYSLWWYLGGIIFMQLIGGIALVSSPLGENMEKIMEHKIWKSQNLNFHRDRFWGRSDDGLMAGKVLEIRHCEEASATKRNQEICEILIRSRNGDTWTIDTTQADVLRQRLTPEINMKLRFIGEKIDTGLFKAFKVVPERRPRRQIDSYRFNDVPPQPFRPDRAKHMR